MERGPLMLKLQLMPMPMPAILEDTEHTVDMEDMAMAALEVIEAMVVSDTEDSMERDLLMLKLNQKLLLMLMPDFTEVMVDTVMVAIEDMEDTEAMVVSDTEDSMERDLLMLKPNQKLLLMLMLVTLEDMAMGDTDMVAMEDTEAMVDLDTGDSMEKDLLRLKLDLDVMVDMDIVAMEDTEATVDLDTGESMERDLLMLNQKLMRMLAILDTEVMLDMEDMDMVDTEAMVDMAATGDTEDTAIMDKKNEIRISTNLSKWKISRLQYQRNKSYFWIKK